ncbi:MAG: repair protein SbcC/Rad50 [Candidatus Woesearchaeota archaeon]|nr:repair protein SbcC/Rad50 [Candidatus Woesearchaeota archaeon]
MIIKSIKLKNIRSYKDTTEIEIPEGKTLFLGDIGSGKSTILQAIEFALFGTGTSNDSLKASSLLRRGESTGFVELKAIIENKEVIIRRNLKRLKNSIKQDNGYIIVNGVKSILSPTELKQKIIELLNYPSELSTKSKSPIFRFTVYTPQEQMKQIFNMSDDERKETFRKLFQIEKYKRIRDNSTVLKQLLKEKRDYLEGYTSDLDKVKEELKDKKAKLLEIESSLKELDNKIKQLQEKESQFNEKIKTLKEKEQKVNQLDKLTSKIQSELELIAKDITSKKEENERLNKEIQELKEEISRYHISIEEKNEISQKSKQLNEEINQYVININSLKKELENINSQLERINKDELQVKSIASQLSELKQSLKESPEALKQQINAKETTKKELLDKKQELDKKIYSNNSKIKEFSEIINKISELKVCPTCLQEVNEEHKLKIKTDNSSKIEEIENLNKKLSEEVEEINKQIDSLEQEISILKNKYETAIKISEQVKNLEQQKIQLEKELSQKESLLNKKSETETKLKALESVNLQEKKKLLSELENKLETINIIEKKQISIKEKEKRISENLSKISQLKEKVKELNQTQIELSEQKKNLEKEVEELKPYEDEFLKVKQELSKVLSEKEFKNEMLTQINDEIKKLIKEIEEKEKAITKLNEINRMLVWLSETFNPMVENIEKHLFARVYHRFNDLFKSWLSKLIDEENIKVDLDLSFSPRVRQNGYDASIFDLSGGEKTSIALAYRLALNQVINDLLSDIKTKDVIILDEPTDGFSSEQMDRVREVLDELNIKQIILVSHESKIESFVDNKFRIYKENSVSRVLQV